MLSSHTHHHKCRSLRILVDSNRRHKWYCRGLQLMGCIAGNSGDILNTTQTHLRVPLMQLLDFKRYCGVLLSYIRYASGLLSSKYCASKLYSNKCCECGSLQNNSRQRCNDYYDMLLLREPTCALQASHTVAKTAASRVVT